MKESEKVIKEKILDEYCRSKPGSIVAEIRARLGDEAIIQLLDKFSGRLIYIPNKSSMKRAVLPLLIRAELKGLDPGSNEFRARVKNLSDVYKLTQKAIIKINKEGVFSR